MSVDEKVAALEAAEAAVKKALEQLDLAWGEYEERVKVPRACVSMGDAGGLLERAGQKLNVAKRHLKEGK